MNEQQKRPWHWSEDLGFAQTPNRNNLKKPLSLTPRHSVAWNQNQFVKRHGMYTASSLARKAGTTVRTIHYYDDIGLLTPTDRTDTGYRLYDEKAANRLKEILFYRDLGFPLKEIPRLFEASPQQWRELLENQVCRLKEEQQFKQSQIELLRTMQQKGRQAVMEYYERKKTEEELTCIADDAEQR